MGIHAGTLNIGGPFDLNNNNMDEALLFNENHLRYVEILNDGSHVLMWEIIPDNYIIKDANIYDINNDGKTNLIIVADYLPGTRNKENKWLHLFSWADSLFVPQSIEMDNGDLLHPNNCDIDAQSRVLSIAVGTPYRAAVLLEVLNQEESLMGSTMNIKLPDKLHNGFGPVFSSFMNLSGETHLAVFSPENDSLKVVLYRADEKAVVVTENILPLNGVRNLIGSAIKKTDLDKNDFEELQLPFISGEVLTLAFLDSVLILSESALSGQNLFILPDSADSKSINEILSNRADLGVYDLIKIPEPESIIVIIPDDTLKLGDTLNYKAAVDTAIEFYSFNWLSKPPSNAYFDPNSGTISWIPRREDIGVHEFKYFIEQRLNEELVSDEDGLGDRHRIFPVLEGLERFYAVIVIDTTKPPIVYILPPYEPYSVSVHTPIKEEGKKRFIFDGEPSFNMMVKEHISPQYPSVSHSISTNLGQVTSNKHVEFSYSSEPDSGVVLFTMTLTHDLATNQFSAVIKPPIDSSDVELAPTNWRNDLIHYPTYLFTGFSGSMRLDEAENGISLYQSESELKTKKNSYISVLTPLSENRHRLSIFGRAIELWNMAGDIIIDNTGNKTVTTNITFSGDINIKNMKSEMFNDAELAARMKELQHKTLEFMGVDSIAVDSAGKNIR
jgi:hypothetical protein